VVCARTTVDDEARQRGRPLGVGDSHRRLRSRRVTIITQENVIFDPFRKRESFGCIPRRAYPSFGLFSLMSILTGLHRPKTQIFHHSHLTNRFKLVCVGVRRPHPKAPFHLATMSDSGRSDFPAQTKRQQIQSLRDTITFKQPVVFGTFTFPVDQRTLFYGENGQLG
jgi:hypothetical protein